MSDQFISKRRWLSRRVLFYLIKEQGADAIEISCVFDTLPGVAESVLQGIEALGFAVRNEEYFYTAAVTEEEALLYFLPVEEKECEEECEEDTEEGAFFAEEEICEKKIDIWGTDEEAQERPDPMINDKELKAVMRLALDKGGIAVSTVQRYFSWGYGKAAKLIDRLYQLGYISDFNGAKPRNVLITEEQFKEIFGE